jgi:hypothetical protein
LYLAGTPTFQSGLDKKGLCGSFRHLGRGSIEVAAAVHEATLDARQCFLVFRKEMPDSAE